ncbi:hypothetical protein ES702_06942 [subsurface metagenome]
MFFQEFDLTGIDWMLGVAIMFGLAYILYSLTSDNIKVFFIWLAIINGFVVMGGLLPLWTLVLNMLILCLVIYLEIKERGVKSG